MDGLTATYLVMFAAGLVFAVASFALGSLHGGGELGHGGDVGHAGGHAADAAHGGHSADGGGAASVHGVGHTLGQLFAPLLNITALAAFCCVFGGVGYLTRRSGVSVPASLALALAAGLPTWYGFVSLFRWLNRGTRYKSATWVPGTVGTLLAAVGGRRVGEIIHRTDDGGRASCPARSADGREIAAGAEIIIVEIADGIALVSSAADLLERKGE